MKKRSVNLSSILAIRSIKIFAVVLIVSIILTGCGGRTSKESYSVPLEVWGVFDNTNMYNEIFSEYKNLDKNVGIIQYKKHTLDSYRDDLLSALAAGNGPDIFMIHNSWIADFQDKVAPIPQYMLTEQNYRDNFIDVVANDFVVDGKMYGVPLSVDSLALYYNKDIFNVAGIATPPETWSEFDDVVKALTKIDEYGNIKQSAVALGTADNVNRSPDILTLMMIQNGTEMSDRQTGRITFADPKQRKNDETFIPGEQALEYYTSFASATEPVYTWNKAQNYSIDEFFEGRTAMMINYSWHYDTIKAKNAKLNFAVSDIPQISFEIAGEQKNVANYWVFVVSKNKQVEPPVTNDVRIHEAWQFLLALTFPSGENGVTIQNGMTGDKQTLKSSFDFTKKYLETTKKPAARRDLIQEQIEDVRLGAFARGNLIAQSWWRNNPDAIDAVFAKMIDDVNTGKESVYEALQLGASRAQQLMQKNY
jgi:multiple sugar transport system substrate-binding protein